MVPLSQLISRTRTRYEAESGGSAIRFSDTNLKLYINEGLETLAEATGFYERYATVPVSANRQYYDLRGFTPETVVSLTSIWSVARNDWLRPANFNLLGSDWELAVGTPEVFWTRGIYWFGVYPRQATTSSYFRVYFQGVPSRFTHTQAVLGDLPDDYAPALEDYTLYEMAAADGNPKRALFLWSSYQKREKSLADFLRRRIVGARAGQMGSLQGAC